MLENVAASLRQALRDPLRQLASRAPWTHSPAHVAQLERRLPVLSKRRIDLRKTIFQTFRMTPAALEKRLDVLHRLARLADNPCICPEPL